MDSLETIYWQSIQEVSQTADLNSAKLFTMRAILPKGSVGRDRK